MTDTPPPSDALLAPLASRIAAVSTRWKQALAAELGPARVPGLQLGNLLDSGIEAIYEGYALHRNASRVLKSTSSDHLQLLIGDWCYAAGLCDVAASGDLDAVSTLADLIADTAIMAEEQPRPDGTPDPRDICWDEALASLVPGRD